MADCAIAPELAFGEAGCQGDQQPFDVAPEFQDGARESSLVLIEPGRGRRNSCKGCRISPDAALSVNDWTAYVLFIAVIGGIGTIEGPIVGTIVFFLLRETLSELGTTYLLILGRWRSPSC